MNITLIRPPAYSTGLMGAQLVPFLGIAYIGAAAREAGHAVDIIDMCGEDIDNTEIIYGKYIAYGMPFSILKERLKSSGVIGFTCTFSQDWVFHRELIRYVRTLYPGSILVAGGEHITALPEYCLDDCPELDICVIGEGERVFVKLLNAIEKRGGFSDVEGLVYRSPEKDIYINTPRANRIKEIDKIPSPAWDLTPIENYLSRRLNWHIRRGRTIPMLVSRGCPYKCTFCSNPNMWGNAWIARDPSLIVDEMEYHINRYKANNFIFSDLTAVINRDDIVNLSNEIINRKIDITWQLPGLRTEAVNRTALELMYKAGCRELDFAIESGAKKVLDSVDKRNDPEKIILLIKDALGVGMNLTVNIVLGLPEERLKELLKTYWLVIKLALIGVQELNAFPFISYPGSKLFKDFLEDKKLTLNDQYFFSLFGYADLLGTKLSWSQLGPRTLSFMRLVLLISFYGLMFISHPQRIMQLIINTLQRRPTTKLEGVLERVFKNVMAYVYHRLRYAKQNI